MILELYKKANLDVYLVRNTQLIGWGIDSVKIKEINKEENTALIEVLNPLYEKGYKDTTGQKVSYELVSLDDVYTSKTLAKKRLNKQIKKVKRITKLFNILKFQVYFTFSISWY